MKYCISSVQKSVEAREGIYAMACYCCLVTQSCLILTTPWTVAHEAPLSMGFPRQQYWR